LAWRYSRARERNQKRKGVENKGEDWCREMGEVQTTWKGKNKIMKIRGCRKKCSFVQQNSYSHKVYSSFFKIWVILPLEVDHPSQ